ncbi:MAG TPA: M14 family zinc carboxypeptidase [Gaiellaceae bacterium]|nr:M14 family zinc carboxypeptidase [Gaiellaceae bacterium]
MKFRFRPRALLVALGAAVAILAVTAVSSAGGPAEPFPVQLVRVNVASQADRDRLTTLGLDLTEHGGPQYVEAVLHSAADAAVLAAGRFTWTVTIRDLGIRQIENNKISDAYAAATVTSPLPSGRDTYRTLADYESDLRTLASGNPSLVRLVTLSRQTLEGRDILGVEISDKVSSKTDGKPVFLMLGLHHAREWPSGEHSIEFAFDLVRGYKKGDKRIKGLLGKARVIVVPVVNADGFEQSRKWGDLADVREVDNGGQVTILGNPGNAYKRKNCRVADGVAPTPAGACEVTSPGGYGIGVDLNRNYGGLWGGPGAADLAADPTYRGAGPFSESETQSVRELIASRQVTTMITNHTFSNLVLRPPGIRSAGETVDEAAMKDLGARMAAQNGYRNIHGWQLYDTTGTTEDWSYAATGGYGYTFEIGEVEFHPPYPDVVDMYLGKGAYAGKGNREAYLIGLENAVNAKHHSLISGAAPTGAVLRLAKEFSTRTSSGPYIQDRLDSTLVVGKGNKFTWHINPSTRPEVMEHRVRLLAQEPTREEVIEKNPVVWSPNDHVDIPFSLPETDAGALKVNLDWPTPDDLDLEVYQVIGGNLVEVGSSGNFVTEKEEALVELPDPGDYVIRVVNYASGTTSFTVTAGIYAITGEQLSGGNVVESYKLTCERPNGQVVQTTSVTVDRGKTQRVDLRTCLNRYRG